MYINRVGCTVWEKTVQERKPVYIRHEEGTLYWEETQAQTIEGSSGTTRSPKNTALVIIHKDSVQYIPKPDDRIYDGVIEDENPPSDALTVFDVRDFLYGSYAVQHIEVRAQ